MIVKVSRWNQFHVTHKMSWTIFRINFTHQHKLNICLLSLNGVCYFFFTTNSLFFCVPLFCIFFYSISSPCEVSMICQILFFANEKKKLEKNLKKKTVFVFGFGIAIFEFEFEMWWNQPKTVSFVMYGKTNCVLFILVSATITKPLCTCHFRNTLYLYDSVLHD